MCEQAKEGSLFDDKITALEDLLKKDESASVARMEEVKIELANSLKAGEISLKEAEKACEVSGGTGAACDSRNELKQALETIRKANEIFSMDPKAYLRDNDEKYQVLYAEMLDSRNGIAKFKSPCSDPEALASK